MVGGGGRIRGFCFFALSNKPDLIQGAALLHCACSSCLKYANEYLIMNKMHKHTFGISTLGVYIFLNKFKQEPQRFPTESVATFAFFNFLHNYHNHQVPIIL